MAEDPIGAGKLCGVRIARGGPVVFVDSAGVPADPFDFVIVALPEGETTAMVVIGPGQIMGNAADAAPSGRIVRMASPDEIGAPQGRDALLNLREAGLPAGGSDWLVPPGGEPSAFKQPMSNPTEGSARSFIDRLFGEPQGASET